MNRVFGEPDMWLRVARLIWLLLAVALCAIWISSLPEFYTRVSTLTVEPFRLGERVIFDNTTALHQASQRGVSFEVSAAIDIGIDLIQIMVYYVTAALIFWRATSGFGWFTAFVLLLMGIGTTMARAVGVAAPFPGALFLIEIPSYIVWPLWFLWLYLFPTGRPVPCWSVLLVAVMFILFMLFQVVSLLGVFGLVPPQIDTFAATQGSVATVPIFGFVLLAQIYRYWKVSTVTERQQTKWFLFGVGMFFLTIILFALTPDSFRTSIVAQNLLAVGFLLFPISVALAVLRYRLFDIDIIIRRTLSYGLLTGALVLVFFGSIILLQQLFSSLTGSAQNELVTVLSTLAIAALFVPLRNRIQVVIDRRFNRRRYDAQQVLANFAMTARDETNLEKLAGRLIEVLEETVQPKTASVLLKKDNLTGRKRTL